MPNPHRRATATFHRHSHPRNTMPDDSIKSIVSSLDIVVQGTRRSPGVLPLDGTEGLRLMTVGTNELVFDLAAGCAGLVLSLHGDGGEQVFGLPWLDPKPTADVSVRWRTETDADGYVIEVPAVVLAALPQWIRSGVLYSASSQSKGPITVFRPRRESPK